MKKTLAMLGGMVAVACAGSAAQAGSNVGISISSGGYYAPAPVYYAPPPVYYAPQPVYYAPRPVVYHAYPPYYRHYTPAYRVNYWNGPRGHRGYGYGHGRRGHGWR